jgi:hypothetical protein
MRPAMPLRSGVIVAAMLSPAFAGACALAAEPHHAKSHDGRFDLAWGNSKLLKERDADRALRETLTHAADAATQRLARAGAYGGDPAHHVALPDPLRAMRGEWNAVGRSGALTTLEAAMNQAAEMAAPGCRPLLHRAIADIDFSDAVAIVRSGDEAATQFFAVRVRAGLAEEIRPLVEDALTRAGAFAALDQAAAAGRAPQRAGEYRPRIIDATVAGEINALFAEMRAEERDIRADPTGRGSPLLRDVFSAYGPLTPLANAGG